MLMYKVNTPAKLIWLKVDKPVLVQMMSPVFLFVDVYFSHFIIITYTIRTEDSEGPVGARV